MPFVFNAVELCVAAINEKPWIRARALEYGKATKVADIVKHLCSRENYAHKWQLKEFVFETNFMDWPKDLGKDDFYIKEEGMTNWFLEVNSLRQKNFRCPCCNVMFPQIQQQLAKKMKGGHRQAIEEKDAVIALMNDHLQGLDDQIQAIKYETVTLQTQKDVYQVELRKCQGTITHLKTRYVPHAKNPGKDNIIIIVRKHTTSVNDNFYELPYYVAMIQRCKRYVKLRWFDRYFPDHEVIVEIDNPNSIHAFNRFEEEGHAERKYNHLRSIDLTREELYSLGVSALMMRKRRNKKIFFSEKFLLNFS